MKIIHKYPDVSGAAMDDVWIYGLNGQVTQVNVNNSPLDATKYEFIAQVHQLCSNTKLYHFIY